MKRYRPRRLRRVLTDPASWGYTENAPESRTIAPDPDPAEDTSSVPVVQHAARAPRPSPETRRPPA